MLKVTCVLTSFNRPNYVRHALESLRAQTYRNFEVVVVDDSTVFDVRPVVEEFKLPKARVVHFDVTPEQRARENRLGINCNRGVEMAEGDLLCFLCDDDYFFPTWLERAVRFFESSAHRDKGACFGRLVYSSSPEMVYPGAPQRFPASVITDPYCALDHNQVVHRRFRKPARWPETVEEVGTTDGQYFRAIARKGWSFYPVDAFAVVKRIHQKSIHGSWGTEISKGLAEGTRE